MSSPPITGLDDDDSGGGEVDDDNSEAEPVLGIKSNGFCDGTYLDGDTRAD